MENINYIFFLVLSLLACLLLIFFLHVPLFERLEQAIDSLEPHRRLLVITIPLRRERIGC